MISIDLFTSLDGVAQAPGGRDEDASDGFPYGGWQAPFEDESVGREIMAGLAGIDALVLGRRTYDIFAAYWPLHDDNPIGAAFNRIPKYVASRGAPALAWANSSRLDDISALRSRHDDVHVIGSLDFAQTLLADQTYDRLRLWVHPLVLGRGKRVFPEGAAPRNLRLLGPARTSPSGIVTVDYAPAPGEIRTGTIEA